MIKIDRNKNFVVTDDDIFIGYTGDNLNVRKEILVENETDISLIYRMYLKFDDGTCNFFLLEKEESDNGTKLIWEITSDQIYKDGIVKAQIKASNSSGEVFHTNSINMLVQSSIEFCDSFAEKKVSEYLQHEEHLNEIVRKGQELYENFSTLEFDAEPTENSNRLISSGAVYNSLAKKANFKNIYYNPGGTGGLTFACDPDTVYNVCFNAPCNNVAQGTKGILFATDENTQILITDKGDIFYRNYNLTEDIWGEFTSVISNKVSSVDGVLPDNNGNVNLLVKCGHTTDLANCTDESKVYYFHSGMSTLNGNTLSGLSGIGGAIGFIKKIHTGWLFISSGVGAIKTNRYISENGTVKLLGGTFDYNDLSNKPTINGVELTGNKTLSELDLYSKEEVDEKLLNKISTVNGIAPDKNGNVVVDNEDIKAYIGYTDSDILGLQVDFENKTFKRIAGAVGLSKGSDFDTFEMYGGRKRCNVSDDGTITAYYGDENYADDGSNGQVMVYQPKFYYRVVPVKLEKNTTGLGYHQRKTNFYISSTPKSGFKLHPAFYDVNGNEIDYILLSAYEGSMCDVSAEEYVNDGTNTDTAIETGDLLCSVAGVKPISGLKKSLTKTNLETMAQNRNTGWHLENIKVISANQLLMIIELGTMNTQAEIGQGVVNIPDNTSYNCSSLTGSTAELGNSTGQAVETVNEIGSTQTAYTESGKLAVSYRGMENPWGNIFKHLNGINIWGDGTMLGGQPYIADDFNFSESKKTDNYKPVGFTLPNGNGYISALGYGGENYDWLLMPSEIGGTNALPVGDVCYVGTNLSDYRIALLGGSWSSGGIAGGFYWNYSTGIGYCYRTLGGRLMYIPTAKG